MIEIKGQAIMGDSWVLGSFRGNQRLRIGSDSIEAVGGWNGMFRMWILPRSSMIKIGKAVLLQRPAIVILHTEKMYPDILFFRSDDILKLESSLVGEGFEIKDLSPSDGKVYSSIQNMNFRAKVVVGLALIGAVIVILISLRPLWR